MANNNNKAMTLLPEIDVKKLIRKCKSKWYWFPLSIILCAGIAEIYILNTPSEYVRRASVLVKGEDSSNAGDLEALLTTGSAGVSAKVANEVIAFQSPALMKQVIEKLDLATTYGKKQLLRENVLFGSQVPVKVEFIDIPSYYVSSMTLEPASGGYKLSKLAYSYQKKKIKVSEEIKAAFGDSVQTAVGRIVVTPNPGCPKEWREPLIVNRRSVLSATQRFLNNFKAMPMDTRNNADILELSIRDKSVGRADAILNTIIETYNENWLADRNAISVATTDFINQRLASLEEELGDVDKDISSYKSSNLLPDVEAVSSTLTGQTIETVRTIQSIENELNACQYIWNCISDPESADNLLPSVSNISATSVSSLISEYNTVLLERNKLLANSSEKNPLIKDATASLLQTRKAIETSVSNHIATLKDQLRYYRDVEKKTNTKIAKNPTQVEYLTSVGRQQRVKESLYLYLLQKREENELSQAFTPYNIRVITPPMGLANPVAPNKKNILAIALLIGLFAPLLIFYFTVLFDNKIRSKKDLNALSFPILGEIPEKHTSKIKGLSKKHQTKLEGVVVEEGNRDLVNEAFRVIRTNLEFVCQGNHDSVILVSSFEPGVGKSFTSVNLSVALGIKGKKVLLIDGDMRHCSTSTFVGTPHTGLSSYLNGSIEDWRTIAVTLPQQGNVSVLPVGAIPPNPSELIAGERFKQMLAEARAEYDFVIVDCPPLEIVADTHIIAHYVDRCIFVARAGLSDNSFVSQIEKLGEEKQMNNLTLVLNGTESTASYHGKYGYYYYGHKS